MNIARPVLCLLSLLIVQHQVAGTGLVLVVLGVRGWRVLLVLVLVLPGLGLGLGLVALVLLVPLIRHPHLLIVQSPCTLPVSSSGG